MKKLLFVLLAAALALPMMSQTKAEEAAKMGSFRKAAVPSFTLKSHKAVATPALRGDIPEGFCAVTLKTDDVWGDGTGYQMLLDADADTYGTIIPETGALTTSGDADDAVYEKFEYTIPENADGSLTTTNIVLNEEVTILIPAGVYDWCITNPTPGNRMWIASSNGNIGGRADDFEFVAGGTYIFYVTLGGQNDQVNLTFIDPNAPVMPENVTVDPATGKVTWENDHDPLFNLRYREYDPNTWTLFWDFEDEADFDGWMTYDSDGDGYPWRVCNDVDWYGVPYANSGTTCMASDSYNYNFGGALEPDNWLISPEVTLGGNLTFWTRNRNEYYPDKFVVYVAVGDGMNIDDYVAISDFIEPGTTYEEYTFDLGAFEGQTGRFAFRHYDCEDQYAVFIDDITLVVPGDEPAEWIYVNGVEGNEDILEGLTNGVTYEVQVQSEAVDGRTSDWTPSTIFTYEGSQVDPSEKTDAPSSAKENYVYNDGNLYYNAYTITLIETEPSDIYYRIGILVDGDYVYGDWMLYTGELNFNEEGTYMIEAYAIAPGKTESDHIWDGFTVSKMVSVEELFAGKTVANVRYFNMAGQEMQQANGMTIVVTTFTDGTTNAVKVVK